MRERTLGTARRQLVLSREDLGELAAHLARCGTVLVPASAGGVTRFAPAERETPCAVPTLTRRPLKEAFFPQEEVLFAFDSRGSLDGAAAGQAIEPSPAAPRRVVFGARPCDAHSLTLLDLVFDAEDYKDPYYVSRRRETAVITFACDEPGVACFCTSLDGGPFDETGSDAIVVDTGDAFLVKVLTDKGDRAIGAFPAFREARGADIDAARRAEERSRERVHGDVPVRAAVEKLAGAFDAPTWDDIHRKCLGCAVCTYLCPTCHCFDIGDEAVDAGGERVRNWDSCMYPLFTLHASGHNPRPSRKERLRQRILHKFGYFVENNGRVACVGCGRCVENCPVNLDVRQILALFANPGG